MVKTNSTHLCDEADARRDEHAVRYNATPEGRDVLDVVFEDYDRIFLD